MAGPTGYKETVLPYRAPYGSLGSRETTRGKMNGAAVERQQLRTGETLDVALVPGSNAGGGDVGSKSKRKLMAKFSKRAG